MLEFLDIQIAVSDMNLINETSKLSRASVPALDELLGYSFKVLDDGFVRLVDYMGSDESIVQAARISYGKGTRKLSEDRGLIRYLMRHLHTTPFEMCEIKLHVRVPMDCWRQWIRHRTANVNEYSTRYSIAIDAVQKTGADHWRKQSSVNKQGSTGFLDEQVGRGLSEKEALVHRHIKEVYDERIDLGVAREQARKDLSLSTYTEAYWKIDLHNLFHFLMLRMDSHAQFEIRSYANVIGNEIVSKWCPLAWEAFRDYRLNSVKFSETEIEILKHFLNGNPRGAKDYVVSRKLLSVDSDKIKRSRELIETEVRLRMLGIEVDWDAS
jgi:thymidylate synthase (FAD)